MSALGSAWNRVHQGDTVTVSPCGTSKSDVIEDGDTVVVAPCNVDSLTAGDVVLVQVQGSEELHQILSVDRRHRLLIGNGGGKNAWVNYPSVVGIAVEVNGVPRPRTTSKVLTRSRA